MPDNPDNPDDDMIIPLFPPAPEVAEGDYVTLQSSHQRFNDRRKYFILDEARKPVEVDMMTWAVWFSTDKKSLAHDEGNGWSVSSIFLGFDYAPLGKVRLMFETLYVFEGNCDVARFETVDDCLGYHQDMVGQMVERVQ